MKIILKFVLKTSQMILSMTRDQNLFETFVNLTIQEFEILLIIQLSSQV